MNDATLANLERKSLFVDRVQMVDGVPLFSWVDLNVTERCNRGAGHPHACQFCPRIDPARYPNQNINMSLELAAKIGDELAALDYQGTAVLCGFGEPMLHPKIVDLVACLGRVRVELVTNGDFLTVEKIVALYGAGLAYTAVSLYDGPHQVMPMRSMFEQAGAIPGQYGLRDRWHGPEDDFGLMLTNRAGSVTAGNQRAVDQDRRCHYPAYMMQVDWNGDVLLCPQDWSKTLRFGNLHEQSLLEVWRSPAMMRRRMRLINRGRAGIEPCAGCNASGVEHGGSHAAAWQCNSIQ